MLPVMDSAVKDLTNAGAHKLRPCKVTLTYSQLSLLTESLLEGCSERRDNIKQIADNTKAR
jgi:hypothetical protein